MINIRHIIAILLFLPPLMAMGDLKLLVLVIASDDLPVYPELQKSWKSYMHLDSDHVEVYFIRGDPDLPVLYEIRDNVIWTRSSEGVRPGLINKTLLSLECILPKMEHFDYLLRANLSSFFYFPKLLEFLKTLPPKRCYCGSGEGGTASGCGFILSPDLVKLIVNNKHLMFNVDNYDDCIIGTFMKVMRVDRIPAPRTDLLTLKDWDKIKDQLPSDAFHFRVKNLNDDLRLTDDIYIHTALFNKYYRNLDRP